MSYLWIVRFSILISLQFISSFLLIYKEKKKISYFTEIFLSIISIVYVSTIIPIIKERNTIKIIEEIYKNHTFTIDKFLWYIIEYISLKIILIILVWILKHFSFSALVNISKNKGIIVKICFKIFGKKRFIRFVSKMWNRVNYGIRIKKGIPGKVGKKHEGTGIQFDKNGFPEFKAIETVKLDRKLYNKTREVHFYKCNRILYERIQKDKKIARKFTQEEIKSFKNGDTPSKYTWHHHQKKGILQLVDSKIHASVNHKGGYSIWGKKEN